MNSVISTEFQGFNSYTPVVPTGPAAPYSAAGAADHSEDKASNKKSGGNSKMQLGGLDENMIKLLTEHGLESDVYSFLDQMEAVIMNAYDPITGKVNYASYKLMLPQLSRIREEGKAFEEARKKMEANGAIDEVAVSDRGQVYVVDPDAGIVKRSVSELQGDEYLLTNGELAKARATNPIAAWNTDFTQTIANGTSTQAITKYILDSINKLGKAQTSGEQFTDADNDVISGAQVLTQMIKGNKGFAQTIVDTETQKQQATYALSYLASTLPSNMATILQLRAQKQGVSVVDLIDTLIQSTVDSKISTKTTFKGAGSGDGSQADESSKTPLDPVTMFALGRTPTTKHTINPGSDYQYTGTAHLSKALNASGQTVENGDTLKEVLSGKMSGALDISNATMGSQKVVAPDLVRLADSTMWSMELPIDQAALSDIGGVRICPDIRRLEKMQEAEKLMQRAGIDSNNPSEEDKQKINDIYEKLTLPAKYDANGNEIPLHYARFAVLRGWADKQAFNTSVDLDESVLGISDQNTSSYLQRLFAPASSKASKSTYKYDPSNMISGNIYIPIISMSQGYENSILGAYQTSSSHLNAGQSTNIIESQARSDQRQQTQFKSSGSFASRAQN